MKYLDTYLSKIKGRGNIQLAASISRTAEDVGDEYIRNIEFPRHEVGLLFGNVQSGKTGQMFGILCKAAELGYSAFILLTTDNVVLQEQTLERVKSDLDGFCICGENDSGLFIENCLRKPVIVVLKKNARILKLWANVFSTTEFMKGNLLFIIDDEADAASLNTRINKNGQSSINKYLDTLKNGAFSSLYLQVTGTPQSIFLQTAKSGWHPLFTYYFRPGEGYLGGDFFFPNNGIPNCVMLIDKLKTPERETVIRHLLVSAQTLLSGETVCNCLIHPSVRVTVHQEYADKIAKELDWCHVNINGDFVVELKRLYASLNPVRSKKKPFPEILACAQKIVANNEAKIIIMNGKHDVDSGEYNLGCNFIIGGNTLGRGVTFPRLQTIYYSRASKKPQADTMWQHSRMFGYDRDPEMMMVFIEGQLYKLFADINATNNAIISQVEQGIDDVKIYYSEGLNPTRKEVLDNNHVVAVPGGTNYYPLCPDNDTIGDISELLRPFTEDTPYYQVTLQIMLKILNHIKASPDFKIRSFQAFLNRMLVENPATQGILIVRRNRNVAQGTGALLSPNDWKLGGSFSNKVVLTMYQVTGEKGWGGKQLWIPNIKFPDGMMYYDVLE